MAVDPRRIDARSKLIGFEIGTKWEDVLEAAHKLKIANPNWAGQVEERRSRLRAQILLLCATIADTRGEVDRKYAALGLAYLHEGLHETRTIEMIEASISADIKNMGMTVDELMGPA